MRAIEQDEVVAEEDVRIAREFVECSERGCDVPASQVSVDQGPSIVVNGSKGSDASAAFADFQVQRQAAH